MTKTNRMQVTLVQGGSVRKASAAVGKLLSSDVLLPHGFRVRDTTLFEHEVRRGVVWRMAGMLVIRLALAAVPYHYSF